MFIGAPEIVSNFDERRLLVEHDFIDWPVGMVYFFSPRTRLVYFLHHLSLAECIDKNVMLKW